MKSSPSNTVVGWFGRKVYTGGAVWKMSVPVKSTSQWIQLYLLESRSNLQGVKVAALEACDRDVCM